MVLGGILVTILWILCAAWVIYDVWTKQTKMKQNTKIIWIICAALFWIVTAIVYYFMVKAKK